VELEKPRQLKHQRINMKLFTEKDLTPVWKNDDGSTNNKIYLGGPHHNFLVLKELPWQKRGLQQTASGYGMKLTNPYMIHFEGKLRRIYTTCFSNVGSNWFIYKGKRIYVD